MLSEGRTDKNFRRDAELKKSQIVKLEIEKDGLPAFELQVCAKLMGSYILVCACELVCTCGFVYVCVCVFMCL